jgi:hypothetical protein
MYNVQTLRTARTAGEGASQKVVNALVREGRSRSSVRELLATAGYSSDDASALISVAYPEV